MKVWFLFKKSPKKEEVIKYLLYESLPLLVNVEPNLVVNVFVISAVNNLYEYSQKRNVYHLRQLLKGVEILQKIWTRKIFVVYCGMKKLECIYNETLEQIAQEGLNTEIELPTLDDFILHCKNKNFRRFAREYKKTHAQFYRAFYTWLILFWEEAVGNYEIKLNSKL